MAPILAMGDPARSTMGRAGDDAAEALALTALAYLLQDSGRTTRFLTATGIGGEALPGRLSDPLFLGCILDFVLEDDALLLAVAEAAGLRAERVAAMRRRLPGAFLEG